MKRRSFLKGAGIGAATAAAAGAFPAPAIAQKKFQWKMVTAWPKNFPGLGTGSQRIAESITAMSDGRLEVRVYAAGELVPAFEVFDAVRAGTAECGHDAPYYWIAKHPMIPFFCSVPGGLTAQEHASWIYFGGGQELWDELYAGFGIRGFLAGSGGPNVGGWFQKEINSVSDFQGLKMRIPGLGGEMLNRLGATTVNLPGGEILAALQSGTIDAAEWVAPYNDLAFGFHKVAKYYYAPGVHEPGPGLSLTVNRDAFDELPKDLQEIGKRAAGDEAFRMLAEMTTGNAESLDVLLNRHGVQLKKFPPEVMKAMLDSAAEVRAEAAKTDEISQRIFENWSTFRKKVMTLAPLTELGYMAARNGTIL
jgi:TRAP-type mannitol/chloroaromatic compound transport system substrate-binding protein